MTAPVWGTAGKTEGGFGGGFGSKAAGWLKKNESSYCEGFGTFGGGVTSFKDLKQDGEKSKESFGSTSTVPAPTEGPIFKGFGGQAKGGVALRS